MQKRKPRGPISKHKIRKGELQFLELTGKKEKHETPSTVRRYNTRKTQRLQEEGWSDQVFTDPRLLLQKGRNILVRTPIGCFGVRQVETMLEHKHWVVYVKSVPPESILFAAMGSSIYVSINQLQRSEFHSSLVKGSYGYTLQQKLWTVLDLFLRKEGVK